MMLLANNVFSVALIMVCWSLAHQNAGGTQPFGKLIAAGYGLLSMNVIVSMGLRNWPSLDHLVPVSVLFGKVVLVATLGAVAWRLAIIKRN